LPRSVFGGLGPDDVATMTTAVTANAPMAVQNHHFSKTGPSAERAAGAVAVALTSTAAGASNTGSGAVAVPAAAVGTGVVAGDSAETVSTAAPVLVGAGVLAAGGGAVGPKGTARASDGTPSSKAAAAAAMVPARATRDPLCWGGWPSIANIVLMSGGSVQRSPSLSAAVLVFGLAPDDTFQKIARAQLFG
jgi:hypothetical protein